MTKARHSKLQKKDKQSTSNRSVGKNTAGWRAHATPIYVGGIFLLLFFLVLLLFYGPIDNFRVFWITTAMHTSDHQYLATNLYPSKTIVEVMSQNTVEILKSKTNPSMIHIERSQEIEKVQVEGEFANGYLLLIHDPSRISLYVSPTQEGFLLEDLCRQQEITAAINASAYRSNNFKGLPLGIAITNGELVSSGSDSTHSIIGLDQNDCLVLGIYEDEEIPSLCLRDAVEYGPFLMINGEKANIPGNGGGFAPRTAIGQTADGTILLLVFDGRQLESIGATTADVQNIFAEYGAVNAACLDGGATASMYLYGTLINSESGDTDSRLLPNAFIVK